MPGKPWSEERRLAASMQAKARHGLKKIAELNKQYQYEQDEFAKESSETPINSTPLSVVPSLVDAPHLRHQWLPGEYIRTDRGTRLHTIYCATGGEWKELD